MLKIKRTYNIITREGTTADIIDVVMTAYRIESDPQIEQLANELRGNNDTDTCRNVWQFLIDKIRYVADVNVQEVKSPARLIHDGTGDCKSYSILTATVLRYLGIDHFFRFVSYSNKKRATHVYVVAIIDNKQIPIDAVAYVQAGAPFGTELKYTYRADMSEQTTTIAYLAGIQRNAIGNIKSDIDPHEFLNSGLFNVWLDDAESDLTQAKGYLLSEWDKYWTIYGFATSEGSAVEALNRLQYIGAMIRFYNENRYDDDILIRGGYAFDYVITRAEFDSKRADPTDRDFFNDAQHERIMELTAQLTSGSRSFLDFWHQNIVMANVPYTNAGTIMGIGSISDIRSNLKKTGGYYLYTYIADKDAQRYGAEVYRKRLIQKRMMDLNKEVLTTSGTMTSAEIDNLVFSGCMTTWGTTPEMAVQGLKPRVGIIDPASILAILKIVAVAVGIIVSIIKAISSIKAVSEKTVSEGMPAESEWNVGTGSGTGSNAPKGLQQASSILLPLLLAGSLLFKNKSKNKE